MAILPNLTQENEALQRQIAELQAKLANASAPKSLSMKVSDKGALSIYGLGRFPVTLYRGQMERLLKAAPEITAFIEANAATPSGVIVASAPPTIMTSHSPVWMERKAKPIECSAEAQAVTTA